MTPSYADTGLICSLYAPDAHTETAIRIMERETSPVAFTWLHQVEFRNAMRLRVFRNEITSEQRDASFQWFRQDLTAGVFVSVSPPQDDVLLEAERLSVGHSEELGTRSLDILHVAMALVLGAERFLGFDRRQNLLAERVGLAVVDR